jgi:hypothetical protein
MLIDATSETAKRLCHSCPAPSSLIVGAAVPGQSLICMSGKDTASSRFNRRRSARKADARIRVARIQAPADWSSDDQPTPVG